MKSPKIIALTGPKGVGKTSFCNALLLNPSIEQPSEVLSFAGPLKDMAKAILPPEAFTHEGKENPDLGLCGVKPRVIMQTIGTDWGRKMIHQDIWVDAMRKRIERSHSPTILIDDLRFENEWQLVKSLGGTVISLERGGVEYTREHASEFPIDPHLIDLVINLDRVTLSHISSHAFLLK
jgi:GTPase SAR1 family protein